MKHFIQQPKVKLESVGPMFFKFSLRAGIKLVKIDCCSGFFFLFKFTLSRLVILKQDGHERIEGMIFAVMKQSQCWSKNESGDGNSVNPCPSRYRRDFLPTEL